MKNFKWFVIALLVVPMLSIAQEAVPIIPKPVKLVTSKDPGFVIEPNVSISIAKADASLNSAVKLFNEKLKRVAGYELPINVSSSRSIQFKIDKSIKATEGYVLNVNEKNIELRASSKAGIIYGIQSLLQTLPAIRTNEILTVPAMQIVDEPRFKWRGMHLDVSRHFFSPELVKNYIDLLATYKMNTFHWHLVDDQGWRIEIKKYPRLTSVGAWRVDQTDKLWSERPQAQPGEMATYGGYYTQQQVKEIVEYAAARNVTVVPEIEMPGHVASAIAAYPHLSCTQKPQLPLTGGNYNNMSSNYCAGNDSVFNFLQDVLVEVMALFPSNYIHIGGDEVDKTPWKNCSRCQQRIKQLNLKNEEELQSYFITRMEKFLISKGRRMIGWDEILEGGLAPEATVMSWRGEAGGIEAARMGHDVVMTPGNPLYFDHYQGGPEGEPIAFGGMNTLGKVYNYDPIPKDLDDEQAKHVLGAQANLWAEHITTPAHVEYMILPRMLALSEVVWTRKDLKNWDDFNQRLQRHFKFFDQRALNYSKGNFKVDIKPTSKDGKLEVALSTEQPTATIHYTLDGSLPTFFSQKYTSPIHIDSTATLKAVVAINGEVKGYVPSTQQFAMHKAIGRDVQYVNAVSSYYQADGPNTLTDGVRGTHSINKYWHGFSGKDMIATIDLGNEQPINNIAVGALQHTRDWIFFPREVKFEISNDGKNFTEVSVVKNDVSTQQATTMQRDFECRLISQKARYIRVTAEVLDSIPQGHPGEGKGGWLFVDEIVVR